MSNRISRILFLCFFILVISSATPYVHAQQVSLHGPTSIPPLHALPGHDLRVTITLDYSKGLTGRSLVVGIWDFSINYVVTGSVYSTPDACASLAGTQYSAYAVCVLNPSPNFGTESLTFILRFNVQKTYQLSAVAVVEDSSNTVILGTTVKQDFTISVSDRLFLNIQTQYPVVVTVDGSPNSPGSVSTPLSTGSHSISVPAFVPVDNSTRLRFDHWSDGSTQTNRTLNLQEDTALQAVYDTQYILNLVSPVTTSGGGWYDAGTSVDYSVPATGSMTGIQGLIGGQWDFQGWYEGGTLVASSPRGSIQMNGAHTLTAHWRGNYFLPLLILAMIIVVITVLSYFRERFPLLQLHSLRKRKIKRRARRTRTVPEPTVDKVEIQETTSAKETEKPTSNKKTEMFCIQCGAVIPRSSKFCKECGSGITG